MIDKLNHPSNSRKVEKTIVNDIIKTKKVVTGGVTKKNPTLLSYLKNSLSSDGISDVKHYVIFDVIIPTVKDLLFDVISGGVKMTLYGDNKSSSSSRSHGVSRIDYSKRGSSSGRVVHGNNHNKDSRDLYSGSTNPLYNVVLASRSDAEDVLSSLVDILDDYEMITVTDYYDLLGLSSEYVDQDRGWTDISSARVIGVRGGFTIKLPRPKHIL